MALTNRLILALADSDECNPDDRGWGPKFSVLKFARAVESATTESLLQRIAELEDSLSAWRRNAELADQANRELEQENKQLKKEVERLRVAHESTVYFYSLTGKKG